MNPVLLLIFMVFGIAIVMLASRRLNASRDSPVVYAPQPDLNTENIHQLLEKHANITKWDNALLLKDDLYPSTAEFFSRYKEINFPGMDLTLSGRTDFHPEIDDDEHGVLIGYAYDGHYCSFNSLSSPQVFATDIENEIFPSILEYILKLVEEEQMYEREER